MKVIKAIFFDLWRTLVYENRVPSPLTELKERMGYKGPAPKYWGKFEKIFMKKPIENYKEHLRIFSKEINIDLKEEEIDELSDIMERVGKYSEIYEDAREIIPKIKEDGYKIAIITNSINTAYKHFEKKHTKFIDQFDAVVKSFDVNSIKPESKIFQVALEKLKIKPEEVIMIGDSVYGDVHGAERLGMHAILIDREKKRKFYPKRVDDLYQFYEEVYLNLP